MGTVSASESVFLVFPLRLFLSAVFRRTLCPQGSHTPCPRMRGRDDEDVTWSQGGPSPLAQMRSRVARPTWGHPAHTPRYIYLVPDACYRTPFMWTIRPTRAVATKRRMVIVLVQ